MSNLIICRPPRKSSQPKAATTADRFLSLSGSATRIVLAVCLIGLSACAKKGASDPSPAPGLTSSTIPDAQCYEQSYQEVHSFPNGQTLPSVVYDCGVRDGKTCIYYIHYPGFPQDNKTFSDTVCL